MASAKKFLPILLLIFIVYLWFFLFHQPPKPSPKQVLGDNTNLSLFIEPDSGTKPIIDAINAAQKEISVEVYLLSDRDIIANLAIAKARGVAVNVILEKHPFGGGNLNSKTKEELTSKGIAVSWSNPKYALTHEKAIIIDDSVAFILSQNLTTSAFIKNREFDIIDKNPEDVTEIKKIFLADWQRNSYIPTKDLDLIESPDNSRVVLENLINSCTKKIDIEVEVIDDNEIASLLNERSKICQISLIIPSLKQISSNKKDTDKLLLNGISVKTMSSPYVHGKMILVDNTKAYIGSVNLSTQSLDENRELGIILNDNNAVQTLVATFSNDWTNAVIIGK